MLQEVRNQSSGVSTNSYIWGLDLSQSLQGAGGIGGLLAAKLGATGASVYYNYDANGNVTELVDMTGSIVGQYEYGPFGEVVKRTGVASGQPFGFSTKYRDDETGLLYYGYRYYKPSTGRWTSRDPWGEWGSRDLYGFVDNWPINKVDPQGLLDTVTTSLNEAIATGNVAEIDAILDVSGDLLSDAATVPRGHDRLCHR